MKTNMKYIQKAWSLMALMIMATVFVSCGATNSGDDPDQPLTGTVIARYYPGGGYMQDTNGMRMVSRNAGITAMLSDGLYRFDVSYKPTEKSGDNYIVDITSKIENLTCTDMMICDDTHPAPEPSQPLIAVKYSDKMRPLFFDDDYLLYPVPYYSTYVESTNPNADAVNHRFFLSYDKENDESVSASVMELTLTDVLVSAASEKREYATFIYRAYKYSDYVKHFKSKHGVLSSLHIKGKANIEKNDMAGAYEDECSMAIEDR